MKPRNHYLYGLVTGFAAFSISESMRGYAPVEPAVGAGLVLVLASFLSEYEYKEVDT